MKYLILGAGYLGGKFKNFLDDAHLSNTRIGSVKEALAEIEKYNPDIVINCIGKTGKPNVDWCEKNKAVTLESNVAVPVCLAIACEKIGKKLVHFSTGCEYEGDNNGRGFSEEDKANFDGSIYSISKTLSEDILKNFDNVLQVRIRMPFDDEPNSRNLITKLLGYKKIIVVDNSLTYIQDMLKIVKDLMDGDEKGIFNVVNRGTMTHDEILKMYQEMSGKNLDYVLISPQDLDSMTVARRSNCVLSTKKLEQVTEVPEIKDAMRRCLSRYVKEELK